jgi:hypothetical protein
VYGALSISEGARWTDPTFEAENVCDRAVGEVCGLDAAEEAAYWEELDDGGRPSLSRGIGGRAGDGLRILDRLGSSASRREGEVTGGVLAARGEAR